MARHQKTLELISWALAILHEHNPETLRGLFYQLVANYGVENTAKEYHRVGRALVNARKAGNVPWDWIEDRTRRPHYVSMWEDLPDFLTTVRQAYRRDVWHDQDVYIEVWLEKQALSRLFEEALNRYGVTLNVGRGFDGWSSIKDAADRLLATNKPTTILYFGDFDPSGEDMARSLRERLAFFGCDPEIVKVALTHEDIERYSLPPAFNKTGDPREKKFTKKYGKAASVELDALPWHVLKERIIEVVEDRMDLDALVETGRIEEQENERLVAMIERQRHEADH